ncbi:MAG: SpoIIE family protein phosphatase [Bacteroidota bacterium]
MIYVKKGNNTIYIATKSNGIYTLNGDEAFALKSNVQLEFTCLTIDQNGVLWAGTYGDGVFKFTSDSLINYSTNKGLKSNYCYSIGQDAKETIWVGHRLGLSRIYSNQKIEQYGPKKGFKGDCNPNAIIKENPLFFIGTNQGMICINSDKEQPNKTPPNTNIISVIINDKPYDPAESIKLPYGSYKVDFKYIGVNLTAPEDVTYSYKLDGFDLGWNQAGNNRIAKYSRLDDGNYTFLVKSCNENGICNTEPTTFNLKISIPFWKTWWFILGVIILLILLVILIIAIRERNHRKLQEYLETQLDLRTKEVQMQKKELEIKNKNITDSINYARRIQSGMLPSLSRIHQTVKDAFVFYLPRDIVSGDFFWFNQNKNGDYIIVCADCTGHGVPGSMLSMIGMTLLKDICNRTDVKTPSDILSHLEKEIQNILNQNEDTQSNDGMDMTIVQLNPKTNKALISSAMQTFIIVKNNELLKLKGESVPIGGDPLIRKKMKKDFKTMEIQLNEQDIIYMFSDGFVDQFGGEKEDKFKIRRMMSLISEIHQKPMNEQKILIEKKFYAWKGDNSQVDDILFMGIRL